METNESNLKPQPTGGLKLMTVFIAVLALHVVVIGGFTVWHLLNPASGDDLALDKGHKGAKIASDATLSGDVSSTDATDKSAAATPTIVDNATPPAAPTDLASTPAPAVTPAASTTTASTALVPKPAPTHLDVTPPPAMENDASSVAANPTVSPTAKTPSGPIQHGPVINPPDSLAPPDPSESTATTVPADSSAPVADGTPYTVKKGDSLARIARRHHVALSQLKTANSLSNDKLKIGQKLVIPNRAAKLVSTDAAPAAGTPEMASIDTATNAPAAESLAPAAPSHAIASTATRHARSHKAASGHHLYTVVRGDTLTKIAHRFRTTPNAIMAANNITNASRLSIGKKLRIPSGESRNAAADSAPVEAPVEPEIRHAAHGQLANYLQ